jgi:hypothetical protein
MPIDPQSGGTWIAVNDAGLVLAIMNVYAGSKPAGPTTPNKSRGTIIPALLDATTLDEAFSRTAQLNLEDYANFRLVLINQHAVASVYSSAGSYERNAPTAINGPILFTSSGLGDALVDVPRRALFDAWFVPGANGRDLQDSYHRHSWPDRRDVSVCMSRPEARTVSCTTVEVDGTTVTMTYVPEAPDKPVDPIVATLSLRPTHR